MEGTDCHRTHLAYAGKRINYCCYAKMWTAYRWEQAQKMYSETAEFWHPLFMVQGRNNIFGAHMFWSCINRKTNARVKRIGRLPNLAAALGACVPLQLSLFDVVAQVCETGSFAQGQMPQATMHGCHVASCASCMPLYGIPRQVCLQQCISCSETSLLGLVTTTSF